MDSEKAEIKVHNIQETDKKNYIGSFEFDLQRVYNQNKDHAIHGQWIGLFNYEKEEEQQVNGFLRLSISVQHESDSKIALLPASDSEGKGNIILPPQLKQNMSFNQLALYFYEANNIPNMDAGYLDFNNDEERMFKNKKKDCQAFITIEYGEHRLQTEVREMHLDRIVWDQCIKIPIPEPRVSDKLFVRLYDKDLTSSQLIGTYELNLEEVIPAFADKKKVVKNKFITPKKIHFYGSEPNESGHKDLSKLMDDNSESGMLYKGTLMMKVLKEKEGPKPLREVENFKRDRAEIVDKSHESWNIKLRVYNYYVFNTKSIGDKSEVKFYISIGETYQAFKGVNYL